jgi:S-adenosylmethionine/arginine decarboxylase-like enzyme
VAASFSHLTAEFVGALPSQLADRTLLAGLMIAAASAGGLVAIGPPVLRALPGDGVGAMLPLDDCYVAVHSFPSRGLLLLDVLTLSTHDARKALDVFTRKLTAREIRSEQRSRG